MKLCMKLLGFHTEEAMKTKEVTNNIMIIPLYKDYIYT